MTDDIRNKMIGTLAWTMFDRFGQQVIQFVISVFLARLLTPNEYTLIALVVVFVSLSNSLVDGGFGSALVRKKTVDDTDLSTVFYFNIFVSILLYTLLYFAAPFIADFYEQPKLVEISRIIFLAILLNAFYLIPNIKLVRKIDVKIIALVNIVSVFFSGIIGILMAANNLGVWALVGQQLSFQLIRVLTVYYFEAWNPKFLFSFKVIKESFSFSSNMLLTTVLNNIFNYVYILILGKFFQKQEVGLYYQANKLNDASSFSFQVILGSTYNVFVKIQDDGERLLRVYRELVRQSSIVTIPLILFLVAVAEPLFFVLFTDKWMGAVPYFKMLSLASLFNPTYTLINSLLNARGNSKITFRIEFIKKLLIVISIFVCLDYGILALLVGYCFANWFSMFFSVLSIKKNLQHKIFNQIKDIIYPLLIGVIIVFTNYFLSVWIENYSLLLFTQTMSSLLIYITLVWLIFPEYILKFGAFLHSIFVNRISPNRKN